MAVSASAVSRLLGKTFERATSETSSIRGWHHYSSGFEARLISYGENQGKVQVGHSLGDASHRMTSEQRKVRTRRKIAEYRAVLETRYAVEVVADGTQLYVSDKEAGG